MSKIHRINQIAPIIGAGEFTWTGKEGCCEASNLGFRAGELPGYQIWNDSADFGFILKSPKTGAEMIFTYEKDLRHISNGDVYGWTYTSGEFKLTIFND